MPALTTKKLIAQQQKRISEIEGIGERLANKPAAERDREMVQSRLDSIVEIWREIRAVNSEIIARDDAVATRYVESNAFTEMQVKYENTCDAMHKLLQDFAEVPSRSNSVIDDRAIIDLHDDLMPAKCPQLDLPSFSGKYEDWDAFFDLFCSLVHNQTRISTVAKLQYLKSCLTGAAAEFVKNVATTSANYEPTWRALRVQYGKPRFTVKRHMDELSALPHLKKESGQDLRLLLNSAQRPMRALNSLGLTFPNFISTYILTSHLDPETRKLWEVEATRLEQRAIESANGDPDAVALIDRLPQYKDLIEFLDARVTSLDMATPENKPHKTHASSSGRQMNYPKRAFHATKRPHSQSRSGENQTFVKCPLCSGEHHLRNCSQFQSKRPFERNTIVRQLRLCFNCFEGHTVSACRSDQRCRTCQNKHHTLLHGFFDRRVSRYSRENEQVSPSGDRKQSSTSNPASKVVALNASMSSS